MSAEETASSSRLAETRGGDDEHVAPPQRPEADVELWPPEVGVAPVLLQGAAEGGLALGGGRYALELAWAEVVALVLVSARRAES
jgi:hypothetical protein